MNVNYTQSFPTGTSFSFEVDNNRQTTNSIFSSLTPQLGTYYRAQFTQQLLAGFGTGPNLRYLRIAKNNKKISDIAFKSQVIATVTQIANIYWDLVSAYEEERVNEQSYAFAQQSLGNAQKQLQLQAIPAMDVMRAEAEVSRRDQDLTVAKTNLQLQESLIKNALTKNLDDPVLESMPVIPTDRLEPTDTVPDKSTQDLITLALQDRPELSESQIDLQNRQISRQAAKNALLPTLALVGFYGGTGLAGELNPFLLSDSQHHDSALLFRGRLRGRLQQFVPGLFCGPEPEAPYSQSGRQGRPISLGAGVSPGRVAPAATEEANSHRSTQRAIRSGAGPRAGTSGEKSARPGGQDVYHHAEGANPGRRIELPDVDRAARPCRCRTRPGERHHGISEVQARTGTRHRNHSGR